MFIFLIKIILKINKFYRYDKIFNISFLNFKKFEKVDSKMKAFKITWRQN